MPRATDRDAAGVGTRPAGLAAALRRVPGPAWVVLLWAALCLPNAGALGLRLEEGRRALQARAMVDEGHWLQPMVCGQRYTNKPPMLPWLIAASSRLTGGLNEWAVRLPSLLATLGAGLLVYAVTRKAAGRAAGVFASAAFFLTPLMLEKQRLGETDALVVFASFAAFAIWRAASARGGPGLAAWAACGAVLGFGAMAKGPPVAMFFAAGVAALAIRGRRLRDLWGLALCVAISLAGVACWALAVRQPGDAGNWAREILRSQPFDLPGYALNQATYMGGVIGGCLPWLVLAAPALVPRWRRKLGLDGGLAAPLAAYALAAAVLLAAYPNAKPRYALPMTPAVAVAAGLTFGWLMERRRGLAKVAAVAAALIAVARVVTLAALPSLEGDSHSKQTAAVLAAILPEGQVTKVSSGDYNVVFYLGRPVAELTLSQFAARGTGGTLLMNPRKAWGDAAATPGLRLRTIGDVPHGRKDRFIVAEGTVVDFPGLLDVGEGGPPGPHTP